MICCLYLALTKCARCSPHLMKENIVAKAKESRNMIYIEYILQRSQLMGCDLSLGTYTREFLSSRLLPIKSTHGDTCILYHSLLETPTLPATPRSHAGCDRFGSKAEEGRWMFSGI